MTPDDYASLSRSYLTTLCSVQPNRRTGSPGNREATDFFADTIRRFGYEIDATPFQCLDHVGGECTLTRGDEAFDVHISPYSLGCDVTAELIAVSTVQELESTDVEGKILLMKGAICGEQLMPKHFVFYNPEHHQRIIALLEAGDPAAIITATERRPQQVGALYPFPLIVDGDVHIPSVYCRDSIGELLAGMQGEVFRLRLDAQRIPSSASNVIARLNEGAEDKVVICPHRCLRGQPGGFRQCLGDCRTAAAR